MIELIREIPGQNFIIGYLAILILICILGNIFLKNNFRFKNTELDMLFFSPYELAFLKGGIKEMFSTALFNLWMHKTISLSDENLIEKDGKRPNKPLDTIEKIILEKISAPIKSADLMKEVLADENVKSYVEEINKKFIDNGLIRSKTNMVISRFIALVITIAFICIGSIKLFLGMSYNKPVTYLAIAVLFGLIFIPMFIYPKKGLTKKGKEYLKNVSTHFNWLKDEISQKKSFSEDDNDSVYAYSLYGYGVLASSMAFLPFYSFYDSEASSLNSAYYESDYSNSYDSMGNDYSSYSDSDSGGYDSGSSDSGSSDGGSGCGGCGGGGCGGGGD